MTRQELRAAVEAGTIRESHTSYVRTYVSRKAARPEPAPYSGRFGKGYTVLNPNWNSTRYSYVTYYLQ